MTPFLQLRLWARQGPAGERAVVAAAGIVVLALAAWAAVPSGSGAGLPTALAVTGSTPGTPAEAAPAPAAGSPGAAPSAPEARAPALPGAAPSGSAPAPGPGSAGAAPATAGGGQAAPASACQSGATAPGVTDTEIHVATTVYSVFGANDTLGIPNADQQRKIYDALWGAVNGAGGVQCRKVVPHYYETNPLDQSSQQSACLKIIADKRFALVGSGGFFPASQAHCIPQNRMPLFQWPALGVPEQKKFSPYVFSVQARIDQLMRTWALGARDQGFFDPAKGFAKLGLWANGCDGDANRQLDAALAAVGISGSKVSKFVADCPLSGQTPPNQCSQAALQHRSAGVTHVFLAAGGSPNACYVNNAQRQRYQPRYSTSDYTLGIGPTTVGEGPSPDAFDGAMGITLTRFGQLNAGLPAEGGTAWCNQALAKKGLPTIRAENGTALVLGTACSVVQLFVATAAKAPAPTREAMVHGIARAGKVAFSWPSADGVYDRPGKVSGGDFFRVVRWAKDCGCWKATAPTFHPAARWTP